MPNNHSPNPSRVNLRVNGVMLVLYRAGVAVLQSFDDSGIMTETPPTTTREIHALLSFQERGWVIKTSTRYALTSTGLQVWRALRAYQDRKIVALKSEK